MGEDHTRPRLLPGGREEEPADHRVAAVLEVLGGATVPEVARRWSVDRALVHRWVQAFVGAGTAQVTNNPDPEAAQQRDRFLAAFAHELRTPLAVAQGWVALLRDELDPEELPEVSSGGLLGDVAGAGFGDLTPGMLADTTQRLHHALGRLAERVLDVELLAQASLGRLRLAPEVVTVGEVVADLPDVVVVGEGPSVEVEVDPMMFRRVLRDLWEAAGLRPEPRALVLEVVTLEHWIEVRAVRRADPIDPSVLQALFEPFDLNDDDTGVTIGLYLARALTVAHGGTLGVDQDEESAVLWVRVPRRTIITRDRARRAHQGET